MGAPFGMMPVASFQHQEMRGNAHENYTRTLEYILQYGDDVQVRGLQTKELLNAVTTITNPGDHCIFPPGRRWNPWVALSEALWILGGRMDLASLLPYNARMKEFSDDGNTLSGAYGWRIKRQIEPLINRLKTDSSDRRAVLSIWREDDLWAETKDPPCNDLVFFKIRKNKLEMTVCNRSNDLHWGLYGVNLPTFGLLQEWLASVLEVELGTQMHLSHSLHVYTGGKGMKQNWAITQRMMSRMYDDLPEYPDHKPAFEKPIPYAALTLYCASILNIENVTPFAHHEQPFLEFADDFLRAFRANDGVLTDPDILWRSNIRHAIDYADWMKAAEIWIQEGQSRF